MKQGWFLILVALSSCKADDNIIYYSYQGVVITRVDREDQSEFYYGRIGLSNSSHKSTIVGMTSRGSDIMAGYLVFQRGNKVSLIEIGDYFETRKLDTAFTLVTLNADEFITWEKKHEKATYGNVARFDRVLKLEREVNRKLGSNVVVEY